MKKIIKGLTIVLVLLAGFILYALSHQLGGYRAFVVSSGSMEPTISTGSLIVTKYVHPTTLQKSDIITFIAPTKEREFVTHRIQTISQKRDLTVIKTKGDHNKTADNWVLAGGGVVGKEVLAIPYLGYFFSFTQSKVGILLFILLPSVYILYTEFGILYVLIRRKPAPAEVSSTTSALSILVLMSLVSIHHSSALLSDSVTLATNQFTVEQAPTPSPTTTPGDCDINITNGFGSVTQVTCSSNNSTTINQSTVTSVTNVTTATSNSGKNTSSDNSETTSVSGSSTSKINTQINQSENIKYP